MSTFMYTVSLKAYAFPTANFMSTNWDENIKVQADSELEGDQRAMMSVYDWCHKVIADSLVSDNHDTPMIKVEYTNFRQTSKDDIPVIGYFNWCDTYCEKCVHTEHIDVSTFSALYNDDENEYICDRCGYTFNNKEEEN